MVARLSTKQMEELKNLCVQNQIKWKGNLSKQGSDGRIVALLLKSIYPKFVDLNNYPSHSSMKGKFCSWENLNFKLLSKLGLTKTKQEIENLAKGTPGYIESLVISIMKLRPKNRTVFTFNGKTLDENEGIVVVDVDKTFGNIICKVPQKMIIYSAFENARARLKDSERKLEKIQQKISHLENLVLLKTEIEEELSSELNSFVLKKWEKLSQTVEHSD